MSSAVTSHGEEHTSGNRLFGFWIYLMSDLIIFALLFATYAVIRNNVAGGPGAKELFDLPYVFVETMFLLISSFTYGLAVVAMHQGKKNLVFGWLLVTFALGVAFISMEVSEFVHLIAEGAGPDRSGFLSGFFTLVGTHGFHVSCGLIWMIVLMTQVLTKGLTPGVMGRLSRLSLFWHFLDIVWVGVFTFVYLLSVV
ncbi:MAG: cytochrome o ubiquinol oxidase subunit III [Spirochaetales bacterium]